MAVPNTFATRTSPIPLNLLDADFAYYDAAFSIIGANITFLGTMTGDLTGNVSGNAGTVTNGVYLNSTQTLTNKTISGSANTLTNIGNGSLTNSAVTIGSSSLSLGGTLTTLAGVSISGATNTLTNIGNGSLTNSAVTIGSSSLSLGGTLTTLAGVSISGATNTLTNIGNGSLTNSSITIGSTAISLGGTSTSLAGLTGLTLASGSITFTGGTANGVGYLNASKQFTTGSALTFDGTNFATTGKVTARNDITATNGSVQAVVTFGTGLGIFGTLSNDDVAFFQNNSEKMRLTSTGLVLGGTSPLGKLDVRGTAYFNGTGATGSAAQLMMAFGASGGSNFGQIINTGNTWSLGYGALYNSVGTAALTWNDSGNLGLGVTPSAWDTYNAFELPGNAFLAGYSGQLQLGQNAYYASGFWRYKAAATAAASRYYQLSGQHIWMNAGTGTAGNQITWTQAMTLDASGRLGIGTTSPTTKLQFGTSEDSLSWASGNGIVEAPSSLYLRSTGAGNVIFQTNGSERARIDSAGTFLLNTTTAGGRFTMRYDSSTEQGLVIRSTSGTFNGGPVLFQNSSGGTSGSISQTASTVLYNVSSDYRLKNIVGAVVNAGQRIDALNPIEYTWKIDGSQTRGFLAHEFQEVYTNSVTGQKDAVDAEGNPIYQAMQPSTPEVIADLVAEIQSLRKRLAAAGI